MATGTASRRLVVEPSPITFLPLPAEMPGSPAVDLDPAGFFLWCAMPLRDDLILDLKLDEGLRLKPYRDSVGKLTLGIGRNLDDVGISEAEAEYLLGNDIDRTIADLNRLLPWWQGLDDTRRRVLLNMGFNLGVPGLLKFKNTLQAVQDGRYQDAAKGMLASKWARQVGDRAKRLAEMMRSPA